MAQAALTVPPEFRDSYKNFQLYPCNLIHRFVHTGVVEAYRTRLRDLDSKLFSPNLNEHRIPTLDYDATNQSKLMR